MVRITRGKVELRKTRVNLTTVVEESIQASRALIEERKLELNAALPQEPVWIDADPTRLSQVFINLLSNAVWYTDHPGTIDIAVSQTDGRANVRIRDTGIGIPPSCCPTSSISSPRDRKPGIRKRRDLV